MDIVNIWKPRNGINFYDKINIVGMFKIDKIDNCSLCIGGNVELMSLCGHQACYSCWLKNLNECPFCEKQVEEYIIIKDK